MSRNRVTPKGKSHVKARDDGKPSSRKRLLTRKRFLVTIFLFPFLAILLGPTIVIKTPLLNLILDIASPELQGQIRVESASFGWIRGGRLQKITVLDLDGSPVAQIDSFRCSQTLFQLLLDPSQLGQIELESPIVHVAINDHSNNIQKLLSNLLPSDDQPSSRQVRAKIAVNNGTIEIENRSAQSRSKIENISSEITAVFTRQLNRIEADVSCQLTAQKDSGTLQFTADWRSSDLDPGSGKVELITDSVPMEFFQPTLKPFMSTIRSISGNGSGAIVCKWSKDSVSIRAEELQFRDLELQDSTLYPDRLALEYVDLAVVAEHSKGRLQIENLNMTSPVGETTISGELDLGQISVQPFSHASFLNASGSVSGRMDFAKVVALLPHHLQLRKDTQLDSAEISWDFGVWRSDGGSRVVGNVLTTDLVGQQSGQQITWNSPIRAKFDLTVHQDGLIVDEFNCQSRFLSFVGRTNDNGGQLAGQFDLGRFKQQFDGIFDLSQSEMVGRIQTRWNWKTKSSARTTIHGYLTSNEVVCSIENFGKWNESNLECQFRAVLDHPLNKLSSATWKIRSAEMDCILDHQRLDTISCSLDGPVVIQPNGRLGDFSVNSHLTGNLDVWAKRIQPLIDLRDYRLRGNLRLAANIHLDSLRIRKIDLHAKLKQLHGAWHNYRVDEPEVTIQGLLTLSDDFNEIVFTNTSVQSRMLAASSRRISMRLDGEQTAFDGRVEFRGDLSRIDRCLPSQNLNQRISGRVSGYMQIKPIRQDILFSTETEITNLEIIQANATNTHPTNWQSVWVEPTVHLKAGGKLSPTNSEIAVTNLTMETKAVVLRAQGKANLDPIPSVRLTGQTEYDLTVLSRRFQNIWGNQVHISGKTVRPFSIDGPLCEVAEKKTSLRNVSFQNPSAQPIVPKQLQATMGIGWDHARIYGIHLNSSHLDGSLKEQQILFDPLTASVGKGRLTISPMVDLTTTQPRLLHTKASIMEDLEITPEMCRTWLRYIAPMVADATQADGSFSLELDHADIPLMDCWNGKASGRLDIRRGTIGPGPLARQFFTVAQQVKSLVRRGDGSRMLDPERSWVTLPEQSILFQMRDGRVRHQGLKMRIGDVDLETSGWVSMNERLAFQAKIPIQRTWVEHDRWLAGLAGHAIEVPIRGTFQNPRLDKSALNTLTRKAVRSAAEGLLQQEIGKQLQRLLPGK